MSATPAGAALVLHIENAAGRPLQATLSGERTDGPGANNRDGYGPLAVVVEAHGNFDVAAGAVVAGAWLHHIAVADTGQAQARRSLVVDDAEPANVVAWKLYASVHTVTRGGDDGDGVCDTACTLREAVDAAATSETPSLVHVDHTAFAGGRAILEVGAKALVIRSPALALDGTDANGDPSPFAKFESRLFATTIRLRAPNAGGQLGKTCPCNESAASLRVAATDVDIRGVALERILAAEGTICCGDQDLIAFDGGSHGSHLRMSRLDGGAAAILSAEVASGTTGPATGKDCIDASATGATADSAVLIEDSEIRFCFDRGAKSQSGWLRLRRNWIHHNLRGGLFAQSPVLDGSEGVIDAQDNLIEQNGLDCPSGDAAACGAGQVVARGGASQISAQGPLTRILSEGNIVRDGTAQGLFFEDGSAGTVIDTYVCGINRSTGGKGILSQRSSGTAADLRIRGSSAMYNDDAGVKLRGSIAADLGTTADGGSNAFAENGDGTCRNVVNALDAPVPRTDAAGNSWEHCYTAQSTAAECDLAAISDLDTNNGIGVRDKVDISAPLAHRSDSTLTLDAATPSAGGLLRLRGTGFDAISGHGGGVTGDCAALATGNTCSPLRGTCVEFLVDGAWQPALDVLALTPTTIVVRPPAACTRVRVRRNVLSGGETVSSPLPVCPPGESRVPS